MPIATDHPARWPGTDTSVGRAPISKRSKPTQAGGRAGGPSTKSKRKVKTLQRSIVEKSAESWAANSRPADEKIPRTLHASSCDSLSNGRDGIATTPKGTW